MLLFWVDMRTLAIGDIHGFSGALETLLAMLKPDEDRLVFLGDYVDRGPDSRGVLERLVALSANPNHVFLRGNHDEWMLRARDEKSWFKTWIGDGVGGKKTLRSYGAATINTAAMDLVPPTHWKFLEQSRLFFEDDFHIYVHASLSWQVPEDTDSQILLWRSIFDIPPQQNGKRVICGHTPQPSGAPLDRGHAVGIDTFCSGTRWLSAFDVESNDVFQANGNGETRRFHLGETSGVG